MNLRKTGLCFLCALTIMFAGYNDYSGNIRNAIASASGGNSQEQEINAQEELEKKLVGSWHAMPMVGSVYADRYMFFEDKSFVFFLNQFKEDKDCFRVSGSWSVSGNKLRLVCTSRAKYEKGEMKIEKMEEEKEITIGPLEEETRYVYKRKIQIGGQYFWKYSDKPDNWNPDNGRPKWEK